MRALPLYGLLLALSTTSLAQSSCSSAAALALGKRVRAAQQAALAYEDHPMDSGIPPEVAPRLIELKDALATATDHILGCSSPAESVATLQAHLKAVLHDAAPGLKMPSEDGKQTDFDKPQRGDFGNDVDAAITLHIGPPRLLLVTLSESVPCGPDNQLLIYEQKDGHWQRALRWSLDFHPTSNGIGLPWGDFFLSGILVPNIAIPNDWRAVVVHGTPWCTSRMSSVGLAVLAPSDNGARIIMDTIRGLSRGGDFEPSLKVNGDTFELRIHDDETHFVEEGFERLVVYRYRLYGDRLTRLQPFGSNARGFVEEWLSAPWTEARDQTAADGGAKAQGVHQHYEASYKQGSDRYTSWAGGPVRACSAEHFQVQFDTRTQIIVPGKPGGDSKPGPTYFFQLLHVPNGYQLEDITERPNSACTGPDLMQPKR